MGDLYDLVSITYGGPSAGTVILSKNDSFLVTRDGAAIVNEFSHRVTGHPGLSLLRSVTQQVSEQVGDGTSTTVLLAVSLLRAVNLVAEDRLQAEREIRACAPMVEEMLLALSTPPSESILYRVAMISSKEDEVISRAIADSVLRVGEHGTVLVQFWEGTGVEIEHRDGLVLSVGWASHSMGKGDGTPREMEGPLVAVVGDHLFSFEDVRSLMEESSQWPGRGLVLFCPGISHDALSTLILNDHKGVLPCIAVSYHHPDRDHVREYLEDIAAVTNSTLVAKNTGHNLKNFQSPWLGSARKITVGRDKTTILSYQEEIFQERISQRVEYLLRQSQSPTLSDYERDQYRERASSLDGGLTNIKVGGFSTPEAQDRRSRAEDTLRAVQQALHGVIPGAGRALHFISQQPELQNTPGGRALSLALREPLRVLCQRAQTRLDSLDLPDDNPWMGWCPVRKSIVDLQEEPAVIDPLNVVISSFRAAVSLACEVIKTGWVISKSEV